METELRELYTLVSGWRASGRIGELERDLALEKLRRVYEAVRFASDGEEDAAPEDGLPVELPVNLDLDQMLGVVSVPVGESGMMESLLPTTMDRSPDARFAGEEPAEPAGESSPKPDTFSVPGTEADDVAAQPAPTSVSHESAFREPEPHVTAPEQTIVPKHADSVVSQPVSGQPTVVEPVLFGLDEIVQHKRKQRVIMSLYDDRPGAGRSADAPVREPSGKPESESRPEAEPVGEKSSSVSGNMGISESVDESAPVSGQQPEAGNDPRSEAVPEAVCAEKITGNESRMESSAAGSVLGEVMNRGVQTLGESIAPARDAVSDMAHKTPVSDLRDAIGLNDKFLLIRDLFDGDAGACDAAIDTLNGFADLDDCMIYIAENYAWNPNSDGARLLVELIERKLA